MRTMEIIEREIKKYEAEGFDKDQLLAIESGLISGVDVSIYAKHEFNAEQMSEILFGLRDGIDVSSYAKPEIHEDDMDKILDKLIEEKYGKRKLESWEIEREIKKYEAEGFDKDQLFQISVGLSKNLDVSIYAKHEFNAEQMCIIAIGLDRGVDVSSYAKPEIHEDDMDKILDKLEKEKEEQKQNKWELEGFAKLHLHL